MTETNIYRLEGLETLSASYRLFEVSGAVETGPKYYAGATRLQRILTRQYQEPFAVIERGETLILAVPEHIADDLPKHHNLAQWVAHLKSDGGTLEIDCSVDGDELDPIRLRFLDFLIQTPLYKNNDLWRPRAGDAFYPRQPARSEDGVDIFEGVAARAAPYPGGGFGVILEAKTKLVSQRSIDTYANENNIRRFKRSSCVYRMGDRWYEITITGAGQTVSDPITFDGPKPISLKEYLHKHADHPIPESLINLKGDGSVVTYRGPDTAQVRAAPAELCFPVLDTHSRKGMRLQREAIQPPHLRRKKAYNFKRRYLLTLRLGNAHVTISDRAAKLDQTPFALPNLLFGGDRTLKGGTNHKTYAKSRRHLLEEPSAGFFEQSALDPQTLVLPQSIMNAWGPVFVRDLIAEVERLYPSGNYNPTVVAFDDLSAPVTPSSQANAILSLARSGALPKGDCAIMVKTTQGKKRLQDKLPALLMNKLRNDHDINASVFHTRMGDEAYVRQGAGTEARYVRSGGDDRGRFKGYLTGLAINKVLIPNWKWPFVLSGELAADVILGIDVKHHTAGIVLIGNGGRIIHHDLKTSSKSEKLSSGIVKDLVETMLRKEAPRLQPLAKKIVVHRDGRIFPSEIDGLRAACETLADEGHIDADFELTVLEIGKTAPAPLRFFRPVRTRDRGFQVFNPNLGEWFALTQDEGFVATTGQPLLPGRGTARPLKVSRVYGEMSMRDALQDVFHLSCLTWTRPESSSRLPISLKLCDTFLKDEGADYDEDDMLNDTPEDMSKTA